MTLATPYGYISQMHTFQIFFLDGKADTIKAADFEIYQGNVTFQDTEGKIVAVFVLSQIRGFKKM